MRHFFSAIAIFVISISVSCNKDSNVKDELKKLDKVVAEKEVYEKAFEHKVDSLILRLDSVSSDTERFKILKTVMDHSLFYNSDMAAEIAGRLLSLEQKGNLDKSETLYTKIAYIKVLIDKNPELADKEFRKLDTVGVSPSVMGQYYSCLGRIYVAFSAKENDPEIRKAYSDSMAVLRNVRKNSKGCDRVTRARLLATDLRQEGKEKEAYNLLKAEFDSTDNALLKGLLAYGISHTFKGNDRKKLEYWLAVSAFYDLQAPVKDYLSLYDLALLRLEDNDLERAQKYMYCTTEDVVGSRFNARIYDAARAQTLIDKTIILEIHNRNTSLAIIAVITIIFLIILTAQLLNMISQNKKLSKSYKEIEGFNDELKSVNRRLNDANKIKDNYVSKYMALATRYIRNTEDYRHLLRQAAKTEGTDAVMAKLREPSPVDNDFIDFFKIFDDLFTSLYPDFFERVSELMTSKTEYSMNGKKSLTTEMRILAVIRLGITDSGKIAKFLNCAPATIYTYRTKIKDAFKEQKDDYVKKIQNIYL